MNATPQFQYRGHDLLDLLKGARNYNRWLTDQVMAARPALAAKIADLGAGCGTFAEMLRDRGMQVTCVDPDPDNQVTLQELGFTVEPSISDCGPRTLDYVYTLNVLEHVPDDESLLRAVFSRLRNGGRVFIFVPAFRMLWSQIDDYVQHQRRYRRQPMIEMLQRCGFVVEKARYADSLGFFAAFLFGRSKETELTTRSIEVYDRLFPVSRALDPLLGWFFGKNLAVTCRKP